MLNDQFKLLNRILFKYILTYFSILIYEPCNLSPASAKHFELECKPQDRSGNGRYFRVKKRPGKEVDAGVWGQEPGTRKARGKQVGSY